MILFFEQLEENVVDIKPENVSTLPAVPNASFNGKAEMLFRESIIKKLSWKSCGCKP